MSEPVPGAAPRRAGLWPRVAVYGSLSLGLYPLSGLLPRAARDDLAVLLADLEGAGRSDQHQVREGLASVNFLPGEGWSLSLFVADDPRFAPGRVAVLTRTRSWLQLELLVSKHHTIVHRDAQAEAFLTRAGISLARLEAVFRPRWEAPLARSAPRAE